MRGGLARFAIPKDSVYYEMDMYSCLKWVKIKFVYYDPVYYEIMYSCLKCINVYIFRSYEVLGGSSLSILA